MELSPEKKAALAKLLHKNAPQAPGSHIPKRESEGSAPLSFAQQRLWFFDQLMPGATVYNLSMPLAMKLDLNIRALERALNEIVRRHEVLRTSFISIDGRPVQVITPELQLPLPIHDLRNHPEKDVEAARLAAEEGALPFDIKKAPLIRTRLVRLDDPDYILLLTMHHIVSDAWSINVFFQELNILYNVYETGQPSPLPELPLQYSDFAVWQRNWLQGKIVEDQLAYWKQQLAGMETCSLPADHPRPKVATFRGASHHLRLDGATAHQVKKLSADLEATPFMTQLAALKVLVHRYTGHDDIVIGSPTANRNRSEIEPLIGFFVNSVVMRASLEGNPTFVETVARVRDCALGAYCNQDLPFEMLVEQLQPERDLSRNPLFQIMFQVLIAAGNITTMPQRHNSVFDLTLTLWEMPDGIAGQFEYNTDLFEAATIERMAERYCKVLEAVLADPDCRIGDIQLLSEAESRQILLDWNATGRISEHAGVHHLIEKQAVLNPRAIALVCGEESLTYTDFNARANQLARHLKSLGAGPENLVGIVLQPTMDAVVAMLAVLKAGAAYVPLDPSLPVERLSFLLQDCKCSLIITREVLLPRLPPLTGPIVLLDRDAEAISSFSSENLPVEEADDENLAYVIYTSGSTGKPKGVCVSRRSLLHSTCARLAFYPEIVERFFLVSPFSFDSSVAGIYWTLCCGGALHIADRETVSEPLQLAAEIVRSRITHLLTVPSLYLALLDSFDVVGLELKQVIVAGEACKSELAKRHFALLPQVRLANEYGPTEAAVWSTAYQCSSGEISDPFIGRPIANTRVYVVDRNQHPVPVGVYGELWIAGAGVARGYLNRPALTAEKFIPNPFEAGGERIYRTGDVVRYRSDGNLEFVGRIDQQVKIRGFRIELGEIESCLAGHAAVSECAAFTWSRGGDTHLALCAVSRNEKPHAEDLLAFLRQRLPEYMVPPGIIWLDELPRNEHGKLNRRALTGELAQAAAREEYVAPRTTAETTIARLYSEVLGIAPPGVHDNFYRLGGHSLLATQLLSRVNRAFQLDLPLRAMFEAVTVATLADVVEQALLEEIAGLSDDEVLRQVSEQAIGLIGASNYE
jgi:amino acid adenylation domain-containing protein